MTGALVGLGAAVGILLIWWGIAAPRRAGREPGRWTAGRDALLIDAGLQRASSTHLLLIQVGALLLTATIILLLTSSVSIALIFGGFAFLAPPALVRRMRARRQSDLRAVWPEAIDQLSSAVRAGMAIPEALAALSVRGPVALRPAFEQFGADYRASGRFGQCLDDLKDRLADPVGDRVCETLRVTREVGGTEVGSVLRTLSRFMREEGRVRAELESRQQTTVNGARLAVAAPWLVLLLLGTQSATLAAYDTPLGLTILGVGAGVCVVAYRMMMRLGRLPREHRVLR